MEKSWKDNWKDAPGKTAAETLAGLAGMGASWYSMYNNDSSGLDQQVESTKNAMDEQMKQSVTAQSLDDLMQEQAAYTGFASDWDWRDLAQTKSNGQIAAGALSGAASGAAAGAMFGPWGAGIGAAVGGLGSVIGGVLGNAEEEERARARAEALKRKAAEANAYQQDKFANAAENISKQNFRNQIMNIAAFGGYIGGNGGDWTDGLTFINTGGSHEQNPYGGVPMGIAPDGQPNLVEEGEVVWNDYVFSDRIKVPKKTVKDYKLKGKKDMTFAEAITNLQKSAEKRPNDPMEQQGLNTTLMKLAMEQEAIRQQQARKEENALMEEAAAYAADGGPIHIAKNKRGTFTAAATKHGKSVQEFASQVLANPENYSSAMVKKANFARNAAKWKHAFGGHLFEEGGEKKKEDKMPWETYLRYAPVLGSTIGTLSTLFDKPNYSYAKTLENSAQAYANSIPNVSYRPISDYLAYKPMDRMFYANELGAHNAATRSAILGSMNANRQAAMNNLLAADYNANIGLGKLYREGYESNLAQRQKVKEFNRGTNQYNSQAGLEVSKANANIAQARANMRLGAEQSALAMMNQEDQLIQAARSKALTGLFDNLGKVGKDTLNRTMVKKLIDTGALGTMPEEFWKSILG